MTHVVALTSGDPAGIGLETAFKAWTRISRHDPFVLICDPGHAADMGRSLDLPVIEVRSADAAAGVFPRAFPCSLSHFETGRSRVRPMPGTPEMSWIRFAWRSNAGGQDMSSQCVQILSARSSSGRGGIPPSWANRIPHRSCRRGIGNHDALQWGLSGCSGHSPYRSQGRPQKTDRRKNRTRPSVRPTRRSDRTSGFHPPG